MIHISTASDLLNREFIHAYISRSYWAEGRSAEDMNACIANSVNFGIYIDGIQIGYARVVTDTIQFAYLMDVFIDEAHKGKGYSKQLMEFILECDELKKVKGWRLATRDAHGLYKQFGFKPLSKPENMMELMR